MDEFDGDKLGIFSVKEKASIIRVFRAWRRERKSRNELRKLVGKYGDEDFIYFKFMK